MRRPLTLGKESLRLASEGTGADFKNRSTSPVNITIFFCCDSSQFQLIAGNVGILVGSPAFLFFPRAFFKVFIIVRSTSGNEGKGVWCGNFCFPSDFLSDFTDRKSR